GAAAGWMTTTETTADMDTVALHGALPISPSCSSTGNTTTAGVNSYNISCLAGTATNYSLAANTFTNGFAVTQKALGYTATGTKVYDEAAVAVKPLSEVAGRVVGAQVSKVT